MARPIFAITMAFKGVYRKYGQNVDHRWKRFRKRFILRNFMAKTKKCEKKWPFSVNFLCKIDWILKLLALYQFWRLGPQILCESFLWLYPCLPRMRVRFSNFLIFWHTLVCMFNQNMFEENSGSRGWRVPMLNFFT